MKKKYINTIFIGIFSFSAFAANHGKIALQSEVHVFSTGVAHLYRPAVLIGLRAFFSDRIGVDAMFGLVFNSGYEKDTAAETTEQPSSLNFNTRLRIVAEIAQGKSANLALLTDFGIILAKENVYIYSGWDTKYAEYLRVIPSIMLGFEPSFNLSDNFTLFNNFGFEVRFNPKSKYIDIDDPSFDFDSGNLPLKKKNDNSVTFGFYPLAIGIRYYF